MGPFDVSSISIIILIVIIVLSLPLTFYLFPLYAYSLSAHRTQKALIFRFRFGGEFLTIFSSLFNSLDSPKTLMFGLQLPFFVFLPMF
jgi:hypothetical protein